jgi:hypothetical protein
MYVPGETPNAAPQFIPAPEPTAEQVKWLCDRVACRARRRIARRPWNEPAEERELPVFKVFGAEPKEPGPKRMHARVDGWDLHASTAFEAHERVAVERFCRYALRGPIANGRLTRGPRDKLTYRLKTPRPDGTTELVLSAMALLERLARLIPKPGIHMTRYFGVLSSGAAWRARIVPKTQEKSELPVVRPRGRRLDWANLLRRVYLAEVLACACGGTRRVIASIEEGPAARKILQHLGLPHELPVLAPARLSQPELWPTGPPVEDACDPPYVDDVQRSPPRLRRLIRSSPALDSPQCPGGERCALRGTAALLLASQQAARQGSAPVVFLIRSAQLLAATPLAVEQKLVIAFRSTRARSRSLLVLL